MKKIIISVLMVTVLLFSLISCGNSDSYIKSEGSYQATDSYYGVDYYPEEYMETEYKTASDISKETNNDLASRKLIKTANLSFQTTLFDEFMSKLNESINEYGGYIDSSNINAGGITSKLYTRSADVTVRVPAEKYDLFVNKVGNLGSLTNKNEYSDDITLKYIDVESRINALETEYEALLDLLKNSDSIDNIIQVRSRISEVQYELESYKSQLRKYNDLVSYCTVNISIYEVKVESISEDKQTFGERLSTGLNETFSSIAIGVEDLSVWLIVNLPYIIIWILVILIIVFVIKLIVKKSKKKKAKKMAEQFISNLEKKNNEK